MTPYFILLLVLASLLTQCNAVCELLPSRLSVDYLSAPDKPMPRISDRLSPRLGWWLTPLAGAAPNQTQSAYRILVAASRAALDAGGPYIYDSGIVASSDNVAVPYAGPLRPSRSRNFWRVNVWDGSGAPCGDGNATSVWEVPLLSETDWRAAAWITRDAPHAPQPDCALYADDPAPLFRARFATTRPAVNIVTARLYVTGLGYFKAYLDGARLDDAELDPPWSLYNTTTYYTVVDVTSQLKSGVTEHVLGISLGNGWWNMPPLRFWGSKEFRSALPGGDPMLRALLIVDYEDGTDETLLASTADSGTPWLVGPSGTLTNSIHLGTKADARREPLAWSTPGFNVTSEWTPPHAAPAAVLPARLRAASVPSVGRTASIAPVSAHSPAPNTLILDVGRNIAGVCEFCLRATSGTNISMRYGELLYKDGSLNGMTSVAGQIKSGNGGPCAPHIAYQTDSYVTRGDAAGECWTPEWTWHGFRYVELVSTSGVLPGALLNATCFPMRSRIDRTSTFASSSSLLNAVHQLDVHTAEANLMSVQSDCPHRERLGYGGDALMSGERCGVGRGGME